MSHFRQSVARTHEFGEVLSPDEAPAEHLSIDDMKRVRLALTVDLGETSVTVRDVLELKQGSIVQLSKPAGEMTDIYVNGIALAKGEVVVIADALHVRIAEIFGATVIDDKEGEYDA